MLLFNAAAVFAYVINGRTEQIDSMKIVSFKTLMVRIRFFGDKFTAPLPFLKIAPY